MLFRLLCLFSILIPLCLPIHAAENDSIYKMGGSKKHLLFNIEKVREQYPDCDFEDIDRDSLYYVNWMADVKNKDGRLLERAFRYDTTTVFEKIALEYLSDTLLGSEFRNLNDTIQKYQVITERLAGAKGVLLTIGTVSFIWVLLSGIGGDVIDNNDPRVIVSEISAISGSIMIIPLYFFTIPKIKYKSKAKETGGKILQSANIKYLKNRCRQSGQ